MQQRTRNTKYKFISFVQKTLFSQLQLRILLCCMQEDTPESPELTFVPVVKLAPVEVKSMEENEDEVFKM